MQKKRDTGLGVPPRKASGSGSPLYSSLVPHCGVPLRSVTRNAASSLFIYLLSVLLAGCFPSMSTAPDPHSIEYDKEVFDQLADEIETLDGKTPAFRMSQLMRDLSMMDMRNHGEVKLFFCGYGVVGKGWGFAYGDFTDEEIANPGAVERDGELLGLTYLKKLDNKWYRFGAG